MEEALACDYVGPLSSITETLQTLQCACRVMVSRPSCHTPRVSTTCHLVEPAPAEGC